MKMLVVMFAVVRLLLPKNLRTINFILIKSVERHKFNRNGRIQCFTLFKILDENSKEELIF